MSRRWCAAELRLILCFEAAEEDCEGSGASCDNFYNVVMGREHVWLG